MPMVSFQVAVFRFRRAINQFRYWRIVIALCLFGLITYPFAPSLFSSDSPDFSQLAKPTPLSKPAPQQLWSYISEYAAAHEELHKRADEEVETMGGRASLATNGAWEWIAAERHTRAPSAGGLSDQGAKASFRTNLRPDKQYHMGFLTSGWNNQVMDTCNSIYVSVLARRIPILPAFEPHHEHLGGHVTTVAVGEIFDLSFLSSALRNQPIIEAHELKIGERQSPRLQSVKRSKPGTGRFREEEADLIHAEQDIVPETLGCWRFKNAGTWPYLPFKSMTVKYTPVPREISYKNSLEHPSIYGVADLLRTYHTGKIPEDSLDQLGGVPAAVPPDQQVSCLDFSYFLQTKPKGGGLHDEWRSGEGVWHHVGQYMRFQPGLIKVVEDFVRHTLGVAWDQPVPLYMGVHIRRGDFNNWYKDITQRQWAHRISQVLQDARDTMGVTIEHVLITTDEDDEAWLGPLRNYGFKIIEHKSSKTVERLDQWFPTIIDTVLLSSGKAFLGVGASTMSILAMRRVIDWHSGIGHMFYDHDHRVPEDWTWHLNDFITG